MNAASGKPRILVAPLDWGLGHATRCVPVIQELLAAGCDVLLAGEGKTESLLRAEFPQLTFLSLKGYQINYGANRLSMLASLILQIPKIIHAIRLEHQWLQNAVRKFRLHAVISDNRYGLYHKGIVSIFITHQLRIKTPFGKSAEAILQLLNYRYINRFDTCWVPDAEEKMGLAGVLSHPDKKPVIPVYYTGPLSRFQKRKLGNTVPTHLLILLSGPEPQRTLLEKQLWNQVIHYKGPVLWVRGLPGQKEVVSAPSHITVVNHLPAGELLHAIEQASVVISRCGYSTVMDLMVLQKKSILIPTPGQTEQEYLARYLMNEKKALCIPQPKFRLQPALNLAASFPYRFDPIAHKDHLYTAVEKLVRVLTNQNSSIS